MPAPRSSKPFLHQFGVAIARVVKKDMDEHQQRLARRITPRRRRPIAHQRDELAAMFFGEEFTTNHTSSRIRQTEKHKNFLPTLR
jgi:hypothetical protein